MSDSLIEQVKRLADSQKCGALFEKLTRIENGIYVPTRFYFDFPALLAHMQAQQAVVDAAREWVETPRFRVDVARGDITPKGLALVAALEKEQSNGKG